jgi:hypothetical protein
MSTVLRIAAANLVRRLAGGWSTLPRLRRGDGVANGFRM